MIVALFAHGDFLTLGIMVVVELLRAAADHVGPVLSVMIKLVGVILFLPLVVLLLSFGCGILTAVIVRKKRWLFLVVSGEALVLYLVFCIPAAVLLLSDWHAIWAWLTIGISAILSTLTGLLNAAFLVSLMALAARLSRTGTGTPPRSL